MAQPNRDPNSYQNKRFDVEYNAVNRIQQLQEELADKVEEARKEGKKVDKNVVFKNILAQFNAGLLLNTGSRLGYPFNQFPY